MSSPPKYGPLKEGQDVADVILPGLDIVFCGTALGRISAEKRAYYANPTNHFWRTLYLVGLTPRLLSPHEFPLLPQWGIGVTDLCKTAFGNDAELPEDAFDVAGLKSKIEFYQPNILAFTSKASAAAFFGERKTMRINYGEQKVCLGETRIFVLPSPSGQARIYWNEAPWRNAAEAVRMLHNGKV